MNAADYFDWWHYSGTGLGTVYPAEKFKQLRQELSRAGANVVTVGEFLEQSPDVIDVGRWRRTHVYGLEGLHVQLTAEALEAIGARRTASAVRETKASPGGLPSLSDLKAGGTAGSASLPQLLTDLREKLAAKHPELAANWPEEVRGQIPQPRQTEGTETREEVVRLLEDYVAAHGQEMSGDIAKYGDPRQAPDFDPGRFLEEQARQSKRLFLLRDQRGELPLLREKLQRLQQRIGTDAPDALPVQRERQKVMEEYRRYVKYAPEDLAAEVRAWLGEVDRLREQHPEVFRPKATSDEQINARLMAIGEYGVTMESESQTIRWSHPPGLECDWTRFALSFYVFFEKNRQDPAPLAEAYERLIAEWERFRQRFAELEPQLKEYVLELFRQYRANELDENERGAYQDEQGQITDEKILASVEDAGIILIYHQAGNVELSAHFGVRWDEEHGVEVQFDEDGEIMRWF